MIKTLPGKAVIPDDSEYAVGGLGLLGTKPGAELIDDCDVLFMIGTNFPYTKHLPEPGKVKVVQVDLEPTRMAVRMPVEVGLVGDSRVALEALLPHLERRGEATASHLQKYQKAMDQWREKMHSLESADRTPIAPQYLMSVIDRIAPDDAVITCDSGTVATWAARHWTIRGDRRFYLSGTLATMAPGLPYAVAMQRIWPERKVIAFVGDGGFAMLMAEFLTAAQHNIPITVVVNNNNSLGQILWEQMVLGYPEHGVRFQPPVGDFSAWAKACGGYGAKVTDPADLDGAIRAALDYDGPSLVDVDVDPNEPPLPGKIEYSQAKKFATAFLKEQPHKAAIATTLCKDRIEQFGSND